jgi:hypothetical protein
MGLNDAPLKAGLDAAKGKFSAFMTTLSGAAAAFSFGSISSQITGFVQSFAEGGREMFMLARRTGASAQELDELKKAAQESGIGFDAVSGGVRRMQRAIGGLQQAGKDSDETLSMLGLTVAELAPLAIADRMELIGQRIAGLGDQSQQTAAAMALFGKSGDELIPMFANLAEARGRAREGGVMTNVDAARAFELSRAFESLDRAFSGVKKAIGSALAPAFTPVLNLISGIVKSVKDWIKENEGLVQAIGWTIGILSTIGAILGTIATAFGVGSMIVSGLGAAFAAIGSVIGAVIGVLGALLSPFVLIAAAIGGIIYLVGDLGSTFSYFGELASEVWGGVVDAIRAGDLELAGRIAMLGLRIVWLEFKNWFMGIWEDIPGFFGRIWDRILNIFGQAVTWLQGRWQAFMNWLAGTGSSAPTRRPGGENVPPNVARQRELQEARDQLRALIGQARQGREVRDRELAAQLDRPDGVAAGASSAGVRGTFNPFAVAGLVGRASDPVVAALARIDYNGRRQQETLEESRRELERIRQMQAVFQ